MRHARGLGWALLWALPVVVADQVLKGLVTRALTAGESHVLVPGVLRLTYTENPAAAFGLFGNLPPTIFIALILTVLGIFLVLAWPFLHARIGIAVTALVLGGAVGNLVDRITRHYVVDYLQFPFQLHVGGRLLMWPVFNLADICVVIGIGLLILLLFRSERRAEPVPVPATTPVDPSGGSTI
jgi:signal peptidase II